MAEPAIVLGEDRSVLVPSFQRSLRHSSLLTIDVPSQSSSPGDSPLLLPHSLRLSRRSRPDVCSPLRSVFALRRSGLNFLPVPCSTSAAHTDFRTSSLSRILLDTIKPQHGNPSGATSESIFHSSSSSTPALSAFNSPRCFVMGTATYCESTSY